MTRLRPSVGDGYFICDAAVTTQFAELSSSGASRLPTSQAAMFVPEDGGQWHNTMQYRILYNPNMYHNVQQSDETN
jgi:hypothetical protein